MKKSLPALVFIVFLILGFAARWYKIDNPIADWHSWRQADTSAVTRNYVKYGINLFFPRYDDFTDVSGTGRFNPDGFRFVEFPIFNLLHLLTYKLLGSSISLEMAGRLTSSISTLISSGILFFIVKRKTGMTMGFISMFFFLFLPFNIYFSRVVLPDPLMVTLFLASINFFDLYSSSKQNRYLVWSGVAGALAVLVKPVAIFFLIPISWELFKKNGLFSKKFITIHTAFLLPFILWRSWSHLYPQGIPASGWLINGNKIRFKGAFFQWIFGERIGAIILGKWGLYPLLSGFVSPLNKYLPWGVAALTYLFTFATGNVHHDYYQIPIIPSISIFLSVGVVQLWNSGKGMLNTAIVRSATVASVLFALAFSWYTVRGNYQVNNWSIVKAGQAVDKLVPPDARVVAPYMGDTAFLYQTNRPGFPYMYLPIKDFIDRFSVTYYVSVNYDDDTNKIINKYTVVEKNSEFVIVKLVEPIRDR